MRKKIAIIEDDIDLNEFYKKAIVEGGFDCSSFLNAEDFENDILERQDEFCLAISDYLLPKKNGIDLFLSLNSKGIFLPFILITGLNDINLAIRALKLGVSDFILKPVDKEHLLNLIRKYLEIDESQKIADLYKIQDDIVVKNEKTKEILYKISRISKSSISVLLLGESGVGKELFARTIHKFSNFKEGPFVPVNCSAIPDTLFESEFFGYLKGSFTGAYNDSLGILRSADGGTIFLDEISELSPLGQAKLLRFLEDFNVQPLGSQKIYKVNLRVLSATNKDLKKEIKEGRFREDLYFRIAQSTIEIPPLRERTDEIIPLANHFIKEISKKEGFENIILTNSAKNKLLNYSWHGNIRELKNKIYEAILNSIDGKIEDKHIFIGEERESREIFYNYEKAKEEFEKKYIKNLLKITKGNIQRASQISGLSRAAIYDLIERNNIDINNFRK